MLMTLNFFIAMLQGIWDLGNEGYAFVLKVSFTSDEELILSNLDKEVKAGTITTQQ